MIRSGSLKEKISIKKPERQSDGAGGFDTVFVEVLSTYAGVKELAVSNDLIAQQANINGVLEFKIRYRQDVIIKGGYKLDWRGRRFEIIPHFGSSFVQKEFIKVRAVAEIETSDNGS